ALRIFERRPRSRPRPWRQPPRTHRVPRFPRVLLLESPRRDVPQRYPQPHRDERCSLLARHLDAPRSRLWQSHRAARPSCTPPALPLPKSLQAKSSWVSPSKTPSRAQPKRVGIVGVVDLDFLILAAQLEPPKNDARNADAQQRV